MAESVFIVSKKIFDNFWLPDHFFMKESSKSVAFLIPYNFTGSSAESDVLALEIKPPSINFMGKCKTKCWSKIKQLHYRVSNNLGNDNLIRWFRAGSSVTLNIKHGSPNSVNKKDCIEFVNYGSANMCSMIAWRSKCRNKHKSIRDCAPHVITGTIQYIKSDIRTPTKTNIILTNVSDTL